MSYLARLKILEKAGRPTDKTDKSPERERKEPFVGSVSTPPGAFENFTPVPEAPASLAQPLAQTASLADACADLPLTAADLLDALDPDEREDAAAGRIDEEILRAFACALADRRARERGKIPANYREKADCQQCGPVWYWHGGTLPSCVWCANRLAGRPIPRPKSVTCAACRHFERTQHEHLGHCRAGQPEPPAGLRDTDSRSCGRWMPAVRGKQQNGSTP